MDSHTVIAEQPHNSIEAPLIVEESDLSRKANSLSEDHHAKYASDAQTITLLHWWFPELFASGLAVLAFISLVVLLKKYDQCGIEATNLPTSLNLNGLIALLSTVIRTALMVPVGSALSQTVWLSLAAEDGTQAVHLEETDAASRGAWGCLLYLFGAKRGWVANTAAAVTIISLGFGTFAQQLLAVGDLRVTDRALNPGNIARSETWRSFTGRPSQGSISVPFDLKAATYGAIMTSKTQPLTLRCPTGNCTWPVTPSLAVCGACAQATVQASCSTTETGITNLCEVFTTSGLKANLSNVPESSMGTSFQVFPSPGFRWKNDDTSKAYVANFEMVGYQASSESTSRYTIGLDILASTPVIASECALWLCVKSYKNTMIAGSATQKVTEIFSEALPVEEGPAAVSKMSQSFLPLPPTMNPHPGANFTVTYLAKYSMQNFLRRLFSGNVTVNTASQESSADIVAAMWPATRSIDEWIENIAASMTDVIRTTNPEPNDYYNGSAVRLAYRVRWVWITLPVLLMLVSLLVLIVAMVQTRRSSVQAWKGSLLTLLFMTPEMNLQRMIDGRTSAYRGYEKAMGKTKIWIEKEDYNRWVVKKRS